jgi:hypothetical protein
MPQATDELRAAWGGEYGVSEDKATDHLIRKGFRFDRGGVIRPPADGFDWEADDEDTWGAVCFMCDEWDYEYKPQDEME